MCTTVGNVQRRIVYLKIVTPFVNRLEESISSKSVHVIKVEEMTAYNNSVGRTPTYYWLVMYYPSVAYITLKWDKYD